MKKILIAILIFTCPNSYAKSDSRPFSDRAWEIIQPIYQKILTHPFNQELAAGTLAKQKFAFYSKQDDFYLVEFSRVLKILASKLKDPNDAAAVLKLAAESLLEGEASGHLAAPALTAEQISPANFHYTRFLLSVAAFQTPEELAAAVLPCFWIYQVLAHDLKSKVKSKNPYRKWFNLYTSDSYAKQVKTMIGITNRLAANAKAELQEKMLATFKLGARMEWYFWQDAYHEAKWFP